MRDNLRKSMSEKGIPTMIYYPIPIIPYHYLNYKINKPKFKLAKAPIAGIDTLPVASK